MISTPPKKHLYHWLVGSNGVYKVDVSGHEGIDPTVRLFQEEANTRILLGENDDIGNSLNSSLSESLRSGSNYFLDILEYDRVAGEVDVTIRRGQ